MSEIEEIEFARVTLINQIAMLQRQIYLADNNNLLAVLDNELENKKLALLELEMEK